MDVMAGAPAAISDYGDDLEDKSHLFKDTGIETLEKGIDFFEPQFLICKTGAINMAHITRYQE